MREEKQSRLELLLLLLLVLVILVYPAQDHGDINRLALGALMFVPVILATAKLARMKDRAWPSVILALGILVFAVIGTFIHRPAIEGTRWVLLAAFFALTVVSLFTYLKSAHSITHANLYTAVSIYLLLGFLWFALYSAIDLVYPGSIAHLDATMTDRSSELLYFSLVTLSTIGYGDIVPRNGEVRMLAALEGISGVVYIAITVALLVSAYKQQDDLR
jgi:hypothetical protein